MTARRKPPVDGDLIAHLAREKARASRLEARLELRDPSQLRDMGQFHGGRPYATRVVAASGSVSLEAHRANYVCDGTDDHEEIQAAIDDCGSAGRVELLEGTFTVDVDEIEVPAGVTLSGQGPGTSIAANADIGVDGCAVRLSGGTVRDLRVFVSTTEPSDRIVGVAGAGSCVRVAVDTGGEV